MLRQPEAGGSQRCVPEGTDGTGGGERRSDRQGFRSVQKFYEQVCTITLPNSTVVPDAKCCAANGRSGWAAGMPAKVREPSSAVAALCSGPHVANSAAILRSSNRLVFGGCPRRLSPRSRPRGPRPAEAASGGSRSIRSMRQPASLRTTSLLNCKLVLLPALVLVQVLLLTPALTPARIGSRRVARMPLRLATSRR